MRQLSCTPQLLSLCVLEPVLCEKRNHCSEKPGHYNQRVPSHSPPQLEKVQGQQRRPSTAKNKLILKNKPAMQIPSPSFNRLEKWGSVGFKKLLEDRATSDGGADFLKPTSFRNTALCTVLRCLPTSNWKMEKKVPHTCHWLYLKKGYFFFSI